MIKMTEQRTNQQLNPYLHFMALTDHQKQTAANFTMGASLTAILVGTVGSFEWANIGPYGTTYALYAGVFFMAIAAVLAIGFGDRARFARDMMNMQPIQDSHRVTSPAEFERHKTPRNVAMVSGVIAVACILTLASETMYRGDIALHAGNQALFIAMGISLALMTLSAFVAFKRHEDTRRSIGNQNGSFPLYGYSKLGSLVRFFAPAGLAVVGANAAGLGLYLISNGMHGPGTGLVLAGIAFTTFALIINSWFSAMKEYQEAKYKQGSATEEAKFGNAYAKTKKLRSLGVLSGLAAMGSAVDISDQLLTSSTHHLSMLDPSMVTFVISLALTLALLVAAWGVRQSVDDACADGNYHQNYLAPAVTSTTDV